MFALLGVGGIGAQHEKASREEAAAAAAQKHAAQLEADRKQLQASLLAAAPGKAAAWRATLETISSAIASIKAGDDLHKKSGELIALRDDAKTWLGQLDVKPPDAAAAASEIESKAKQVQAMTDFVDGVATLDRTFQEAKALIAKRSWLEADHTLEAALQQVATLQVSDPSFRALVGGFDPNRKKTEVAAIKAGIAGAVASAQRRQAAAEAAERKRAEAEEEARVAAAAYLALCGEAPTVSSWDGEIFGLARTIRETANDPDSIDVSRCTQPVLTKDNCWVSTCNVRGKNGFGALILLRQTWSYSKALGFRPAG